MVAVWAWVTAGAAVLVLARGLLPAPDGPPPAVPTRIDVNRATVGELMALPGIGRTRAEAIVLHRVRHGWFAALDDLVRVDGIGDSTVAGLRAFAVAGGAPK